MWRTTQNHRTTEVTRNEFQSTSPVWRTTEEIYAELRSENISIHVPRVEDDERIRCCAIRCTGFQSTSPVWRTTTRRIPADYSNTYFNPRPPCGGRPEPPHNGGDAKYFNPRPPCGGRQQYCTNRMQHHFTQTGCSAYFFFITSFSHRLYHFAAAVFPARMHRDFYVRFTFAESDYQRLGYVKRRFYSDMLYFVFV